MKAKVLSILLVAILLCCVCGVLSACGSKSDTSATTEPVVYAYR